MNWSIEQNFILLQFVKIKGENEWLNCLNDLKDLFTTFLTNVNDNEYNNFLEDDFKRQYNYILATTKQECLKQNFKILKSCDLAEIALKKFQNFLEQQNHRDDKLQLQSDLKSLEDGNITDIADHKLIEMREKVYCVYGEDIIGKMHGLVKLDEIKLRDKREKCLKELTNTWVRRLNDGSVVMAGDNGIFDDELIEKLGGVAEGSSTDSDATETLEDIQDPTKLIEKETVVIPYQQALIDAGFENLYDVPVTNDIKPGCMKELAKFQKWIPGWHLQDYLDGNDKDKIINTKVELDDRFSQWLTEQQHQQKDSMAEESKKPLELSQSTDEKSDIEQISTVIPSIILPPPNSPSNCTGASIGATTPTTTTVDDLDETLTSQNAQNLEVKDLSQSSITNSKKSNRKRKSSKRKHKDEKRPNLTKLSVEPNSMCVSTSGLPTSPTGTTGPSSVASTPTLTRDQEARRKVMRNLLKILQEHRYSSLLLRPLTCNTKIFKQEIVNIPKILQTVNDALIIDYDSFIEQLRLFFLQLIVYYCQHDDVLEKLNVAYNELDKQISIICPSLLETVPLCHLINRRESRYKGHYA